MTPPFTLGIKWIVGSSINTLLKDVHIFGLLFEDGRGTQMM